MHVACALALSLFGFQAVSDYPLFVPSGARRRCSYAVYAVYAESLPDTRGPIHSEVVTREGHQVRLQKKRIRLGLSPDPMSGSSFWGTVVKPGKAGTPLRTKASQLTMVLKQVCYLWR